MADHKQIKPASLAASQETNGFNNKPVAEHGPIKARILLVDDDRHIRKSVRRILECDYTVRTAENGIEGLKVYSEEKPDVVISDIRMPQMGGIELARAIKMDNPEARVIMMSGTLTYDEQLRLMDVGVSEIIEKPFSVEYLQDVVRRALTK